MTSKRWMTKVRMQLLPTLTILTAAAGLTVLVLYILKFSAPRQVPVHIGDSTFLALSATLTALFVVAVQRNSTIADHRAVALIKQAYPLAEDTSPRYGLMTFTPRLRHGTLVLQPPTFAGHWDQGHLISSLAIPGHLPNKHLRGVRSYTTLEELRRADARAHTVVMVVRLHPPVTPDDDGAGQYSPVVTAESVWVRSGTEAHAALDSWIATAPTCDVEESVSALIQGYPTLAYGDDVPLGRGHLYATTHPNAARTQAQRRLRRAALMSAVVAGILYAGGAATLITTWWAAGATETTMSVIATAAAIGLLLTGSGWLAHRQTRRIDDRYGHQLRDHETHAL